MEPTQGAAEALRKWLTSLGVSKGFLKKVMPELSREKKLEFTKSGRGTNGHSRWVEAHVQKLRSIMFYRKPLNAPGREAGEVWGGVGERLANGLEVMGRNLGFI